MSNKTESLTAILASARASLADDSWIDEITQPDEDGQPNDYARRVVPLDEAFAALDRIEAAAERKRRNYQRLHKCFWSQGTVQSVVRQMLDAASDLQGAEPKAADNLAHFAHALIECAKPAARAPGNAAALREAHVEILDRTNREKARDYDAALNGGILEIHDIANTALNQERAADALEWKKICAACAEGTPPERCAYYGEPDGCNAPTIGAHPEGDLAERLQEALEKAEKRIAEMERASGNVAAMREALAAFVGYLTQRRIDEVWAKTTLPEPGLDRLVEQARAALAAPARNCDRFATAALARRAFEEAHSREIVHNLYTAAFDWSFSSALEGGAEC